MATFWRKTGETKQEQTFLRSTGKKRKRPKVSYSFSFFVAYLFRRQERFLIERHETKTKSLCPITTDADNPMNQSVSTRSK